MKFNAPALAEPPLETATEITRENMPLDGLNKASLGSTVLSVASLEALVNCELSISLTSVSAIKPRVRQSPIAASFASIEFTAKLPPTVIAVIVASSAFTLRIMRFSLKVA